MIPRFERDGMNLHFKRQDINLRFKSGRKSGSTFVEASLVFPLIILVAAGLISVGISMLSAEQADADVHEEQGKEVLTDDLKNCEDLLRARWVFGEDTEAEGE